MSKARIYDVQGHHQFNQFTPEGNRVAQFAQFDTAKASHSALVDEDYLLVGNYVDEGICKKIGGGGEYVDFAKLMLKDKLTSEDDHHMEFINKGVMSYWIPAADLEVTSINSYAR